MTDRLDEIRSRAEAANHARNATFINVGTVGDRRDLAHAREDIPYLLAEVERLRAERAFLAARQVAHATYADERCWGLSSDWLAYSACGIDYPKREPADPSDLMACWRTMKMAPPHIRKRMEPPFYAWVEMICEKWPTAADEVRAAITERGES